MTPEPHDPVDPERTSDAGTPVSGSRDGGGGTRLAAGTRLGIYEILAPLGAGAMDEVYRARDTNLDREVAIKVLTEEFAADESRARRFQREAKTLAALNHSSIAQIYAVDQSDSTDYIAMELVPGESLDRRLARGALSVLDALRLARDIAEGLEVAHEAGVVHRDLKPANVCVTPDGVAKILDFGLAKPMRAQEADSTTLSAVTLGDGRVIGTPTYMAPEQIDGKPIDRRVDVWAFGCVLYECLTGRRAFDGESLGSLFAAIASESVDLTRVAHAPAAVRSLLERCLRKDPKQRQRDMGSVRIELEDVLAGRTSAPARGPRRTGVGALLLLVGAFLGGVVGWSLVSDGEPELPPAARYSIALPFPPQPGSIVPDGRTGTASPLAVSPDGSQVVFSAVGVDRQQRIYLRSAADPEIRPLPGTEGQEMPCFSPDGRHVCFGSDRGVIHRIRLADQSVRTVGDERSRMMMVRGLAWLPDDTIVYGRQDLGLYGVSASGGAPEPFTELRPGDQDHRWPQLLPGGRLLYTASREDSRLEPRIVSLETGDTMSFPLQGVLTRYVPEPGGGGNRGFLMYVRVPAGDLWAVRVDLDAGRIIGDPGRILDRIHVSELGMPHVAVGGRTLVYEPARPPAPGKSLLYVDRDGNTEPFHSGQGYESPRVSPDGEVLLFANHGVTGTHAIWAVDRRSKRDSVLTRDGNFIVPVWSPDGTAIAFTSFGDFNLYTQRLNGEPPRPLLQRRGTQIPLEWRSDGRLLFFENAPGRATDVLELTLDTLEVRDLIVGTGIQEAATVSPDGRWLAYVSDKTGAAQIYLRSYPEPGLDIPVSRHGGVEPAWSPAASPDGQELFFRNHRSMLAVTIPPGEDFTIPEPRPLFQGDFVAGFQSRANYAVVDDGQRFIMIEGNWGVTAGHLEVHLNFDRELDARLPRGDD